MSENTTRPPMLNWAWCLNLRTGGVGRICGQCAEALIEQGAVRPELEEVDNPGGAGKFRIVLYPIPGLTFEDVKRFAGHGPAHH